MEETAWLFQGTKYPLNWCTDHQALLFILRGDDAHGRLARWQYRFAKFDYNITHIPGKDNPVADGLSRLPKPVAKPTDGSEPTLLCLNIDTTSENLTLGTACSTEEIGQQLHDTWERFQKWAECEWYTHFVDMKTVGYIGEDLGPMNKTRKRHAALKARRYVLVETEKPMLGYRERGGRIARCMLPEEIPTLLSQLHDHHGQFAVQLVLRGCIGKFYWPQRHKDIHHHCKSCFPCQIGGTTPTIRDVNPQHADVTYGYDWHRLPWPHFTSLSIWYALFSHHGRLLYRLHVGSSSEDCGRRIDSGVHEISLLGVWLSTYMLQRRWISFPRRNDNVPYDASSAPNLRFTFSTMGCRIGREICLAHEDRPTKGITRRSRNDI